MTRLTYRNHFKRLLDFSGALAVLIISSPLQGICALAIRLTSGRPVLFHQQRVGMHGRLFRIHKFRTMQNGTEELSGNYPGQESVTPVGRFLRRTSLDELPQLLNVLAGEMSFVGPRPALPSQAERYSDSQRERLSVRPGITGLAQIQHRNSAPWSVRIEADRAYANNITLLKDVELILLTIPASIRGDGQMIGQTAADVDDLGPQQR